MIHGTFLSLLSQHVCFQSGVALNPCLLLQSVWQPGAKALKKERKKKEPGEGEWRRIGVTEPLKGKKKRRQGRESRKGLTVRENVRLIEASFAQLFLVAARHCAARGCRGWDPDVLLRRGSLGNNNPLEYRVMQETGAIRASCRAHPHPSGSDSGGRARDK